MTDNKAGIYVHFPFCLKKCLYCGFYSIPYNKELENRYITSLIKEIHQQKEPACGLNFGSIYIGGGTPSLMNHKNLTNLLTKLHKNFRINNTAEITIEVNPVSVNDIKINEICSSKINRVSLGIQSFDDDILQQLGRPHNSKEALATYNSFTDEGLDNISSDLIFAIPGQTMEQWKKSLGKLIDLSPKHISLYSFSFDKGTQFTKNYQAGKIIPADENLESLMYEYAIQFLSDKGYVHYEISNFALPGYESRHNKLYWNNYPYVGLGASAFSYINKKRYSAVSDVQKYINFIETSKNPYNYCEILDYKKSLRETAALNLRLIKEGINLPALGLRYKDIDVNELLKPQLDNLVNEGLLINIDDKYSLTAKGILLADYVASCVV